MKGKLDKKTLALQAATLKKVLGAVGSHTPLLGLSLFLSAAMAVLQLLVPVLFGDAIDAVIGTGAVDFETVGSLLLRAGILIACAAAASWAVSLINNRLTFRTVRDIRARAIRQIETLPLSYLDSHSSGDIVQRVIGDVDLLSDGLLLGFTQLFSGVVTIVVTIAVMFLRDFRITLLVLAMTPVSFLVAGFIAGHTFSMFREQTAVRGRQTAMIGEIVGNEKVVKAFGREEKCSAEFAVLNEELQKKSQMAVFFSSLTNPSTRAVNNVIYAAVALLGAFRILSGGLTVGGLTILLHYAGQYMKPFNEISSVITELQNALACAARLFDLIEAEPEVPEGPAELVKVRGQVTLDGVDFSYDPEKPLIEGFTYEARPGSMTAIVGPTGCGKTTLINLLMRFYDVDAGSIRVDGADVRSVTRTSLRRHYGMVLQDTWIRGGTVRDNIAFGSEDLPDEEIIRAARETHCWEFIRRMPKGLYTEIRESDLSQGQKQLMCITRAMLRRPPMLILDEATSSIDTRTELQIREAFARLMEGRTSFVVAHRLSTIRDADCILVMRDGHVLEQGRHEQLLAAGGFYRELYDSQFAGSEEE